MSDRCLKKKERIKINQQTFKKRIDFDTDASVSLCSTPSEKLLGRLVKEKVRLAEQILLLIILKQTVSTGQEKEKKNTWA